MSASFSDEVLVQPCIDISLLADSQEPKILPRETTMATEIDLRQFGAILEIYREALSPTSISIGTLPGCEEKKVAIKKIFKADLKTDFQKRQAAQEFPLHCSLKHEKIVKGHEWTENATEYVFVMEYMDNPCYFEEKIDQNRRPVKSEDKMKSYIRDVLEALSYLHSKGIVHGDIKFENMLIKAKEDRGIPTVKVCDFGLSRVLDKATKKFHMETPVGTLCYMAPEIKANSYVDEKIDMWALGVILYKMAVAYRPTQVAGYKYGTGPIPFRACDWRKRSPELQDLIKRLLETDPAQRISAAEALEHSWFQT